jgi:MFS family permease
MVYFLGAVGSLFLNFSVTKILRYIHLGLATKITMVLSLLNLVHLFFSGNILLSFISYVAFFTLGAFAFLLSSIMLEDISRDDTTGRNRGGYLMIQSVGFLLAPFLSSFFVKYFGTHSLFLVSSLFVLISIFIFNNTVSALPKIPLRRQNFFSSIKKVIHNSDLRNIVSAQIGLYVFYTIAIVYMPFKLISLGIGLSAYLGVLLPIALTPFIFVPRILGYVEDKMKNEREFLIFAFFGIILCVLMFALVESHSLLVWALILFTSRFFASIIETSAASYFFKKVDKTETDLISIFTSADSFVAILFVPIFSLLVTLTDVNTLFLSVSFFLTFMLVLVNKLHDTKNYERQEEWRVIWKRSKKRVR